VELFPREAPRGVFESFEDVGGEVVGVQDGGAGLEGGGNPVLGERHDGLLSWIDGIVVWKLFCSYRSSLRQTAQL